MASRGCAAYRDGKRCGRRVHETQTLVMGNPDGAWEMRLDVRVCRECSVEADLCTARIANGNTVGLDSADLAALGSIDPA